VLAQTSPVNRKTNWPRFYRCV